MTNDVEWWKKAIIYQIYPRSFKDSNNDGIGDLQGIISKLNYLKELGISAIWLSPCFSSPMQDFGYDISDYKNIDPVFGTLDDMDTLIRESHTRQIKVILDYVANHSSDQHPWFQESKKSKTNPKSDYYIWKDKKPDGLLPNNWVSVVGGSVWEWCEDRQQYYYHSFLKCQPDLNWANLEVQTEMLDVLHFWLKRGIDGFRIDMISWLFKDPEFRDNPINQNYDPKRDRSFMKLLPKYTVDQPGLFLYLEKISVVVNNYKNKVIIGEVSYSNTINSLPPYYGKDGNLVHLPAMFEFIKHPWDKKSILSIIHNYYKVLPSFAWANFQFGNHDRSRMATRLGGREIAREAAVLLLTLKGTPFIYNGEELGMIDVEIPSTKIQDPTTFMEAKLARDSVRTPFQWDTTPNSGFSNVEPWLPISLDYKEFNVQSELRAKNSFLQLYKSLLSLRNTHDALTIGDIELIDSDCHDWIGYYRLLDSNKIFGIFVNFSNKGEEIDLEEEFSIVLSSLMDFKSAKQGKKLFLRKNEACIIKFN